jgi:hydroxyacylglutathione hydrolase
VLLEPLSLWVAATNAWIVAPDGPGGECVLVDAPPEPGPLLARLAELELRLVALISTHGHIDHVGGIGTVVRDPRGGGPDGRLPVHIHDADRHMLVDLVRAGGMMATYLEGVDTRPPEVIEGLDDGTVVRGAGMEFRAVHTPGHTQGSVCLRLDVDGVPPLLFSGDHLFAGSTCRVAPSRSSWSRWRRRSSPWTTRSRCCPATAPPPPSVASGAPTRSSWSCCRADAAYPRRRPEWRNGRLDPLKRDCSKGRAGSNPASGTPPAVLWYSGDRIRR